MVGFLVMDPKYFQKKKVLIGVTIDLPNHPNPFVGELGNQVPMFERTHRILQTLK